MTIAFAVVVFVLSSLAWVGQVLSAVAPRLAIRWGLTEPEHDVDPAFFADVRGECVWDSVTLWTLPLASALLMIGRPSWAVFGLVGGGMFVYFGGRGIAQRVAMLRRGISAGKPSTVTVAFVFLGLWGAIGMATIAVAAVAIGGADRWR